MNRTFSDSRKARVFSGIKPTGEAHIGNYLGALRNWVALQDSYDTFYCVVDLHAMTTPWDPAELRRNTLVKTAELLACGVDPARSVLFVQSHVPAHSELAWVLTCIARMGELRRMTQFKDKSVGGAESASAGLFAYPVLMAADILLYETQLVPVGDDQRQHVELTRDIAGRFNSTVGQTFVLPEPLIPEVGARIMALDDPTQKMSKSGDRPLASVELTDGPDWIAKKLRSAVTDSGREVRAGTDKPALSNLLTIYSLFEGVPVAELEGRFAGSGYGAFKDALAEVIVEKLGPIRQRYEELISEQSQLDVVLAAGAEKAAAIAGETMAVVRDRVGLLQSRVIARPAS
ncbi:MAG: tryptophan--tRNA ligase [Actinomycetota bacterium]|nr:tryptophan--tRNA ligase [Actinomycetota bacterium]